MHAAALALENLIQEGCPEEYGLDVEDLMERLYGAYEDFMDVEPVNDDGLWVPGGQVHVL